ERAVLGGSRRCPSRSSSAVRTSSARRARTSAQGCLRLLVSSRWARSSPRLSAAVFGHPRRSTDHKTWHIWTIDVHAARRAADVRPTWSRQLAVVATRSASAAEPRGHSVGEVGRPASPIVNDERAGGDVVQCPVLAPEHHADEAEAQDEAEREDQDTYQRRSWADPVAVAKTHAQAEQSHAERAARQGERHPLIQQEDADVDQG